jgi:hypothetical protein
MLQALVDKGMLTPVSSHHEKSQAKKGTKYNHSWSWH